MTRTSVARALSVLMAAGLTLAAPATAPMASAAGTSTATAAAAADSWSVPARAWVTIKGHGYGHGHGMSQYGAEGAARQGLTYEQIANFYYPGTTWGLSRGKVTVQISADTTDDLVVLARPSLTVRDTAGGDRLALPANGATRWRLTDAANGATQVSYLAGTWRTWRTLSGDGELYAGGSPITLVTPGGERAYRGRLRAVAGHTVNDLTLESYLKGVVPLEMPAGWSTEAVRAQSVAARTYASFERMHPRSSAYQLCDTTSCQVYGGYDAEHQASNQAINATRRRVLMADGAPAFTQFGSSSGGWTSAGSRPYLTARADPYDGWSGNPVHAWSLRVEDGALERAFPAIGNLTQLRVTSRDGNGDWGGRVRSITITGDQGQAVVSGDTFRSRLGLRSSWVTFAVAPR